MTEEIAKEPKEPITKKIFAEGRGRYTLVDTTKVFHFEFPLNCTIEENFAAISFIKEEILKTIQAKEKEEKPKETENKEKPFTEVVDEALEDIKKN